MTASLPPGDLLTASEAALELRRSVDAVRRLAAEGVLERVDVGSRVRYTPESVAACKRHLAAGSGAAASGSKERQVTQDV